LVIVEIVFLLILLFTRWTVRYSGWRRRLGAREDRPRQNLSIASHLHEKPWDTGSFPE
jgi:hypothetical protein